MVSKLTLNTYVVGKWTRSKVMDNWLLYLPCVLSGVSFSHS